MNKIERGRASELNN